MKKCKIIKWVGSWHCETHNQKISEASIHSKTTPMFCYWGFEDAIIELNERIKELKND